MSAGSINYLLDTKVIKTLLSAGNSEWVSTGIIDGCWNIYMGGSGKIGG